MTFKSFFLALKSAVLKVFVFWVLLFAAYLALGRQFFPLINKFEPEIEQWLSSQFQTTVTIGSVEGQWARFGPVVKLTDINLGDALTIQEMVLAPGVFESLSHGGLSFLQFELNHFKGLFYQTEQGWQLDGLRNTPEADQSSFDIEKLLQLIQRQKNIQFLDAALTISPLDLPSFDLVLNNGHLSGYQGLNGLVADAQINYLGLSVPIELQMEVNEYQPTLNKLYLKHGTFDFSPWLNNLTERIEVATASGEYWLNFDGRKWDSLSSRLKLEQLTLKGKADSFNLVGLSTELFLERKETGIELSALVDSYQLNGQAHDNITWMMSRTGDLTKLTWDQLPADTLGTWFALDDTSGFWSSLNLRGSFVQGSAQLDQHEDGGFTMASAFVDGQIDSYGGVPGLNNLHGQLIVKDKQGLVKLGQSESAATLPLLFDQGLHASIQSSLVSWNVVQDQGVLLNGHHQFAITDDTESELSALPINIQWFSSLKNSQTQALGFQNTMGVSVYSDEVNEEWVKAITKNSLIAEPISEFIDDNLKQTNSKQVEFSYVSTGSGTDRQQQFDFFANIAQTDMSFLNEWDVISDAYGQLSINEQALSLELDQAQYQAFGIDRGRLDLELASGDLQVDFSNHADADNLLSLFKTGPLRSLVNNVIDDWYVTGNVSSDVHLDLNLNQANQVSVTTLSDITEGTLFIEGLSLTFDDINGLLQFNSDIGLLADNIDLKHEGYAQRVRIDSEFAEDELLVNIYGQGETPLAYWGHHFNDLYLASFEDTVNHQTTIQITNEQVAIRVESDFDGVEIDLPAPLNKSKEDIRPTRIDVSIDKNYGKKISIDSAEILQGYIELNKQNVVQKGTFAINRPLVVRTEPGVYIDVNAQHGDGDAWWQAIGSFRELYETKTLEDGVPSFESMLKELNLYVDSGIYLGRVWTQANIELLRNEEAWIVAFDTEEARGSVLVPHNDEPLFADIEWLSLVTEANTESFKDQIDPLIDYLPTDVPNLEFQIKQLIWNERNMGDWRASIQIDDGVLSAQSIVGHMPGMSLTGALQWQVEDGEHNTAFNGVIDTGDILTVLNEWQFAPVLTSRDGHFELALNWRGSPAFFDFKRVQGKINLALTKGAILEVEEYEGVKLIGLLNFTRVLQRIALDFSDLLASGITFDTIDGELLFDRGFARVGEKLVIDGASTNFIFSGDADLLANVIDIDMVLTVPLSSTFPLVALLAGVSPQAAAAIYVTERVFNNELKKISSARMHITGSFEEPIIKFYRVFDNQIGADDQSVTDRLKNVMPETANP